LNATIKRIEEESNELLVQKNHEMDKNLKTGETIDEKNERILHLEKELQRKVDEINCRKEMIDSMSNSLLAHEKESRELASKLVMLKN
jgi:hypothetical protein